MFVTEQNKHPSVPDPADRTRMFDIPKDMNKRVQGGTVQSRPVPRTTANSAVQNGVSQTKAPAQPRPVLRSTANPAAQNGVSQSKAPAQPRSVPRSTANPAAQNGVSQSKAPAQPRPVPRTAANPAVQDGATRTLSMSSATKKAADNGEQALQNVRKPQEVSAKTTEVRYSDLNKNARVSSGNQSAQKKKEKKKKERTKFADGEGGNTIISMVKAIVYIISVVMISVFLAACVIFIGNDVFAFVKNDEVREVVIPEDADLNAVTDVLYENEIIAYPSIFKIYADLKEPKNGYEFVAGTYSISPMYNYEELLFAFKKQVDNGVTDIMIPEGYTTDEIIDLFVSRGIGTKEKFVDVINNYDFDYWFIDELGEDWSADGRIYRLDGYLFPDTYQFYNNSSEVTVVKKLLRRFNQIFTKEYRNQCAEMGYSVDEIITLASMIEKEAGAASEFFYVSSVFHNRLEHPSVYPKLESDATIVYAIQHETGERPNLKETTYETPYNTYIYSGLPPGPIANPSASAILAALSPVNSDYYFFISDAGVTKFSETLEQHEALLAQIKQKQEALGNQQTGDMSADEAVASGQSGE